MLYDAHCHLQDPRLRAFRQEVTASLEEIGAVKVVVNGTRESDWPEVLALAASGDRFLPALGLHPWHLQERTAGWAAELERLAPPAIGEIGLDRWMRGFDMEDQEHVFIQQLRFAAKHNRAVSIHCLRAWGRLLEILSVEALPQRGFLLHSYGGPAEMIPQFSELGAFFSISGYFAHARKAKQREIFKKVPLDRLLVETDAPDMALPAELQEFTLNDAELNHPANLRAVYRFAAGLRELPFEALAEIVEQNFHRLFS